MAPSGGGGAGVEGFSGQGAGFHAECGGCPFESERNRASRRRQGPRREVARPSGRGRGWPDRNRAGAPAEFPLPVGRRGEAPQGGRARAKASAGVR